MELDRVVSSLLDSNTFVLHKNGCCLVVDAGAEVEKIKEAVHGDKVVGMLLTHGHYDHAYNATKLASDFGCKIYCSANAKQYLLDPKKNYGETFCVTNFSNFNFLQSETTLHLGEFDVQVIFVPGHSLCSIAFVVEKILFAGDTLFKKGIGRTDLFGSSKQDMLSSLKKLEQIDFETLASGHGENSTKKEQQRNLQIFIKFLSR